MNPLPGWHAAARGLLDLVYPPHCAVCDRPSAWLCSSCIDEIQFVQSPVCPICGRSATGARRCPQCQTKPPQIDGIRAVGYLEGPLQTAIHRFKYSNLRHLAVPLAKLASEYLAQNSLPVDAVVPVPLHPSRIRERGYNQAALLAREISSALDIPVVEDVLLRVRRTIPQVGLSASERKRNVKGAFRCTGARLQGGNVLLVDDVCTTGATMESCSVALRDAGAKTVWGLALARERWHER